MFKEVIKIRASICIATYNGENYIEEQLNSILEQCLKNDEVIISDDYSTDGTWEILRDYSKDERVKIYRNEKEKGYTSNFENALKKAKGMYIFLSDQDDKWNKDKLQICIKQLQENDMVISDCFIVDKNMTLKFDSYFNQRGKRNTGFWTTLYKTNYLGCCMAFKKEILEKALPFPLQKKLCPHDLWLGLVGFKYYKVKILDDKLIYYRRHDNNVSNGGVKGKSLIFKIKYRIYALIKILKIK